MIKERTLAMKGLLKRALALILPTLLVAAMILPAAALTAVHNVSEEYRQSPYYRHLRDLELTGDQRTDVVLVALSQLGYHEGDSEADMHGLNTKGSKNFVEYNRLHGKFDNGEGNGVSYGYHWCCSFATWCARQAGIDPAMMPSEISCWRLIEKKLIPMGIYHPVTEQYVPRTGDYIFFRGEDALPGAPSDHVGIVLYVEGNTVYTVEGNSTHHSVAVYARAMNDNYIVGYASPNYRENAAVAIDFNARNTGYPLNDANYAVIADVLTVRADAGTQHKELGYLSRNDIVVLREIKGAWGRIDYGVSSGWVSLKYLQYLPNRTDNIAHEAALTFILGEQELLTAQVAPVGTQMTIPALPARESTEAHLYTWAPVGWDSDGDLKADLFPNDTHQLWADTALQAIYQKQQVLYTVRFYGADGVLIEEKQYPYNATLTPPDMAAHAPEDGRIFDGWDSMLLAVTEDIDYHAVYLPAPEPVRYTIRFLHRDGTLLLEQQLLEGEMPTPPNNDPRLAIDDGSVFLGWDSDIVPATADAEYRAVYEMPPDDPDPDPEPEPEPEDDEPSVVVVIFALLGVLLLAGAVVLVIRTADKSRNTDDADDWA
jgi:hypothetical protein